MLRFSELKGKSVEELEKMLDDREDNYFFWWKLIAKGQATREEFGDKMDHLEQEIDILTKKLKK